MNLLKDPRTNWKFIITIVLLAFLVGGGILTYQYWWMPKEEAKLPEVKPSEVKTPEEAPPEEIPPEEIADWKTFRNGEFGYEIKYPKEWLVEDFSHFYKERGDQEHLSDIRFSSQGGEAIKSVIINVYDNSRSFSLNQWFDFYTTDYSGCSIYDRESILIAGVEGIKGTHACGDVISEGIFLPKGNRIYNIDLLIFVTEGPIKDFEQTYALYNQMLSTFRFLE